MEISHSLLVLLTGLILGLEHALEPDHLVAVSVYASERKDLKAVAGLGASWGLGHTVTLLLVGGGALLLNITIPDQVAAMMELLVGLLLIGLGINVFVRLRRGRLHHHQHAHDDGSVHDHLHPHRATKTHEHVHRSSRHAFLVGLLHGGAGSAAAVLLVATMVGTVGQGLLLILLFGVGSIFGMMTVSFLLGLTGRALAQFGDWQRGLHIAAGTLSVVLGVIITMRYFAVT